MVILTWNFGKITQRFLHFGRNDGRGKTAAAGKTTLAGKTRITGKDVEVTDVP